MGWKDDLNYDEIFNLAEYAANDAAEVIETFIEKITPEDLTNSVGSFSCFSTEEFEVFMQEVFCAVYKSKRPELIKASEQVFKVPEGEGLYYVLPHSYRLQYKTRAKAIEAYKRDVQSSADSMIMLSRNFDGTVEAILPKQQVSRSKHNPQWNHGSSEMQLTASTEQLNTSTLFNKNPSVKYDSL